jgi:hypothetical protein
MEPGKSKNMVAALLGIWWGPPASSWRRALWWRAPHGKTASLLPQTSPHNTDASWGPTVMISSKSN